MKKSIEERFYEKTRYSDAILSKHVDTPCLIWTGGVNSCGYGKFWLGKECRAHRIAYQLAYGDIPEDQHVMHLCDVPACVRWDHLVLGTHRENMTDMTDKRRYKMPDNTGEKHGNAKLSEEDVLEMRNLHARGVKQRAIAEQFGLSYQQTSRIINRKQWTHI